MAFKDQTRIKKPANPQAVSAIEALRCFFGLDRELTTAELKNCPAEDRAELAKMVCDCEGWTLVNKPTS